jgi:hypothetical protein
MLSFTTDVFLSVFEHYNRAIWPAQIIAYGLGFAAVLLALGPVSGGSRLIAAFLAVAWAWIGVVYHLMHFATIDFAGPAYGAFFVLQGLLFGWTGTIRGKVAFRFRADPFGWTGLSFIVYAMAVHPLIEWLAGHGWPSAPLFGVSPGPTTIFTMGLLLLTEARTPLHLVIIPVLWSLMGGAGAWLLDLPQGLALPLAGVGGFCLILWKNRRQRRWRSSFR